MDLERWRIFKLVAEVGSLSKAAARLGIAPSAVSRRIGGIELECGLRLFLRTGRGMVLSEAGQRILPHAHELIAKAERLDEELRAAVGAPGGRVRIGFLPSTAQPLLSLLFQRVRTQFPGVQLQIFEGSSGEIDELLVNGLLDIGILYRYHRGLGDHEFALAQVDTYLIGARGDELTAGDTVAFKQLDGLPLILPSIPNGLRTALNQLAKKFEISLSVVLEANSLVLQKDVTASGHTYTVLPLHAVMDELQRGQLQAARIVDPGMERLITLSTTTHRPLSAAARQIGNLMRLIVDDLAGQGAWRLRMEDASAGT